MITLCVFRQRWVFILSVFSPFRIKTKSVWSWLLSAGISRIRQCAINQMNVDWMAGTGREGQQPTFICRVIFVVVFQFHLAFIVSEFATNCKE